MIIKSKKSKKKLLFFWLILILVLIIGVPYSYYIGKAKGIDKGFDEHVWVYAIVFILAFLIVIIKGFSVSLINIDYSRKQVLIIGFNPLGFNLKRKIHFSNLSIRRTVAKYGHAYVLSNSNNNKIELLENDFLTKDYENLIGKLREIECHYNIES